MLADTKVKLGQNKRKNKIFKNKKQKSNKILPMPAEIQTVQET